MPKLATLEDVASVLPVEGKAIVVRPDWMNPSMKGGGSGLEFRTKLTLQELVEQYHDLLVASTYAAQFLKVYCVPGSEILEEVVPLDHTRHELDMAWHTDRIHRDNGGITAVYGTSSVPTGVASKPLIAQQYFDLAQLANRDNPKYEHKCFYNFEGKGEAFVTSDRTSETFRLLHEIAYEGYSAVYTPDDFWDDIQAINAHSDIVWMGEALPENDGLLPTLFLCRMIYHCKGFTRVHSLSRDGDKKRLNIAISPELRTRIDGLYAHQRHNKPDPIQMQWLHTFA